MDYAVVGNKTSELAWSQVQAHRKQKKGQIVSKAKVDRKRAPRLIKMIRSFADIVAKTALFLGFVYGAFCGFQFLTTSPQFAIEQIEVKGNHIVSKDQLLQKAGRIMGSNIFTLNTAQLSKRLSESPWIRSVSIERCLPQGLRMTVVERVPYARIQLDKIYILDNFGVLLSLAEPEHSQLPLILGAPAKPVKPGENVVTDSIIRGLHTMRYFNSIKNFHEDPVDTLHMVGNHRIMLSTRNKGTQIFMDMDMLNEGFKNFKTFMETFADGAKGAQYIDLSFKGKVVVKHASVENKQQTPH
jgi:hypothetical protein